MYKVVKLFTDLQDNNHEYRVGDEYPRLGLKPSLARIQELSSNENRQRTVLIKEVNDFEEENTKDESLAETPKQKKKKQKQSRR
jgi:hypothetical protein